MSAIGAAAGAVLASGVLLVAGGVRRRRAPTLAERIAPYVEGASSVVVRRDDLGARIDASTLERLMAPTLRALLARMPASTVSDEALRARLAAAGLAMPPESYRLSQLVWGMSGVGIALLLTLGLTAAGSAPRPFASFVLLVVSGATGLLLRDRALSRRAAARRSAITAGLPVVADLLALAVASGESPSAALARVARVAHGPLADECARACHEASSGAGLVEALEGMAARVDVAPVRRFVDGVVIAVQRGTPLADVLRAQAGDARAEEHRRLLELAGRKELLMLLPVVFLVLPTVVLVALYPAVTSLAVLGS